MTPSIFRRLLWVSFALAMAAPAYAQTPAAPAARPAPATPPARAPGAPPGWWHSEATQRDLKLTPEQIKRIDGIYQDAFPRLEEDLRQLDERESKLSRLIETNADEMTITHQIDRVEALRSAANKERQLMLFHMRAVLTPDQIVKFNERWLRYRESEQNQQQRPPGSPPRPQGGPGGAPSRSTQPPPSSAAPTKRPE